MSDALAVYFLALERLKAGQPVNVPLGTKITNDSVSIEAGRKKGSIKSSRPVFRQLIDDIATTSRAQSDVHGAPGKALDYAKAEAAKYRVLWEEALAREVSLFYEFEKAQQRWAKERAALTGEKVTLINARRLRGELGPND